VTGQVLCECGEVLVSDVDEKGVTTVDGTYILFQRKTDFVACASCMRSYPVRDLLPSRPTPADPVERLEDMLDGDKAHE